MSNMSFMGSEMRDSEENFRKGITSGTLVIKAATDELVMRQLDL